MDFLIWLSAELAGIANDAQGGGGARAGSGYVPYAPFSASAGSRHLELRARQPDQPVVLVLANGQTGLLWCSGQHATAQRQRAHFTLIS